MELLSFGGWWEELSTISQIYWMIAIPASIIFVIQLIISFGGSKAEKLQLKTTGNTNIDSESAISFQLINFRNFIGFFTSLGWSGLACIDSGLTTTSTILTSFVCGIIMMAVMATIFFFMQKLMKDVDENL